MKAKVVEEEGLRLRKEGEEEQGLQTLPFSEALIEQLGIFSSISIVLPHISLSSPFPYSTPFLLLPFHTSFELCRHQGRGPEQEGGSSKPEIKKTLEIKDKKNPEI